MASSFDPTPELLAAWARKQRPVANEADVARLEAAIGEPLPGPYREFICSYGSPLFDSLSDNFEITRVDGDNTLVDYDSVGYFFAVDDVIQHYRVMTNTATDEPDVPKYPRTFLPIGSNAGQDAILLELGENGGGVWFWYFNEWPWGEQGNTVMWRAADNLYEFINALRRVKTPLDV